MSTPHTAGIGSRAKDPTVRCTGPDPPVGLPAPAPEMVRAARALMTPLYATGVQALLWETRQEPMPDQHAIDAVVAASDSAQSGAGTQPTPLQVAAALVLLGAIRLQVDQAEVRLLNTAQASGLSWEQIAATCGLSAEQAEERYRELKPRLDEPTANVRPPRPARSSNANRPATPQWTTRWGSSAHAHVWDELDDQDWGTP